MTEAGEQQTNDAVVARALDLLRQAIDAVHDLTPKEYRVPAAIEFIAVKMMWQSVSKCEAIHNLASNGLLDEASIVLRSLMWDVQRLIYMDQNPEQRNALLFGLANKHIHNLEDLATIAEQIGVDAQILRESVIKQRQAFEKARTALEVTKLKRFPSEGLDIARSIGRLNDMLDHQMLSGNAHSAALSMLTNVSAQKEGKVHLSSRNKKPGFVSGITASAVDYLFKGAIATARAQGWDSSRELLKRYAETKQQIKQLDPEKRGNY